MKKCICRYTGEPERSSQLQKFIAPRSLLSFEFLKLYIPGESKKVSAFGELWNNMYVTTIQN